MYLEELHEYMNKHVCMLTVEDIHYFNNEYGIDGGINNVIRLIKEHCFGMSGDKDSYILFYITNTPLLKGISVEIKSNNPFHNKITLAFAKTICDLFPESKLNFIDVANTLQQKKRDYYTKIGDYIVIDSNELLKNKQYENSTLVCLHKPIDIPSYDKLDFYRDAFDGINIDKARNDKTKDNKIYILFNERNGLCKIGRSIHANKREKTLQGEDPKTELLACWIAPKHVEKELHEKFNEYRGRGEWFSLNLEHLEEINSFMEKYK